MHFNSFWISVLVSVFVAGGSAFAANWDGKIVEVQSDLSLGLDELAQRLAPIPNVLIGERHYSIAVQKAEGEIIRAVVRASHSERAFTTAWEFMNYSDQEKIDLQFAKLVSGEIDAARFLQQLQGSERATMYSPMIEATRDLGGKLIGVNLSREQKEPVVKGGISAVDPAVLPPGFAMGGDAYYERFDEAMAGHATPETIRRYFEAQCLTDDVMAYRLLADSSPKKFLIAGSFHLEFFDATAARFKTRLATRPELPQGMATIRIVDASDYTEDELPGLMRDAKYGAVADYVFFVNEPFVD